MPAQIPSGSQFPGWRTSLLPHPQLPLSAHSLCTGLPDLAHLLVLFGNIWPQTYSTLVFPNQLCQGSPPQLGTLSLLAPPFPIVTVEGRAGHQGRKLSWVFSAVPTSSPTTGPTPGIVSQGLGVMQSLVDKWWEWEAVRHTIFFKPTSHPEKQKQRFFQMGYKQQLKKLHRLSSPSKGAKAGHSAPDRLPVPTQSVQPALPHLSARRA